MFRVIFGITMIVIAFALLFLFIAGPENKLMADVMTALVCQPGERFTQVLGGYSYNSDGSGGQSFDFYCQSESGQRDVTGIGVIVGIAGFVLPFLVGLGMLIGGSVTMTRSRRPPVVASASFGFTPSASAPAQTDPFGNPINVNEFHAGVSSPSVQSSTTYFTVNGSPANMSDLPPETAKLVEQMFGSMGAMMNNTNFSIQSGDLSERLKQLQNSGVTPEKLKMIEQLMGNFGMMMNTANFPGQGGDLSDKLRELQEARDKNLISQEEYDKMREAIIKNLGQ